MIVSSLIGYSYFGTISGTSDAYDLVMFFEQMHPTWQEWLIQEKPLLEAIEKKVLSDEIAPAATKVMAAFASDPKKIKVILLGQDPYPTPGDAIGLAFAMNPARKTPRSLTNIAKELETDLGVTPASEGNVDISAWAGQGVMLLNRALSTKSGISGAHLDKSYGWQEFTLRAITRILENHKVVLILWGKSAQSVKAELVGLEVICIESAHPSPLSARNGFFGSRPFSRTNSALESLGLEPIDWSC
jgi:uracil-DNA glycosylase